MAEVSYNTIECVMVLERSSVNNGCPQKSKSPPPTAVELKAGVRSKVDVKPSALQRVKKFGAIEAYLFLALFSLTVKNFVNVKLTFVKACVSEMGLSYDECVVLDEHSEDFKAADKIASWYIMVSRWVSTPASIVMGMLIGCFCDKYQKKVPLLLAPLGFAIESAISMFCAVFIGSSMIILVVSKAPAGLFGGLIVVLSGTNAYIRQVADPETRQMRFAILQMLNLAGVTLGTFTGGFLFQEECYVLVYTVSILANFLGIIILLIFIEDKNPKTKTMTYGDVVKTFFSIDCLRESYRLVVAPREGNRRLQVWLLIFSSFVTDAPLTGTRSLVLLYVKKRYSWDTETTAYITGALRLGTALVTIAGVRVFAKHLKMRDPMVALIGFSSLAADYLCRGVATTGLVFTFSHVLGSLSGCANSAMSNLLNKQLNEEELGKVFVFRSLVDLTSPAVGTSFFSMVSREFEDIIPGAMFISAGVWIAIPTSIMVWILIYGTQPTPRTRNLQGLSSASEIDGTHAVENSAATVGGIHQGRSVSRVTDLQRV